MVTKFSRQELERLRDAVEHLRWIDFKMQVDGGCPARTEHLRSALFLVKTVMNNERKNHKPLRLAARMIVDAIYERLPSKLKTKTIKNQ